MESASVFPMELGSTKAGYQSEEVFARTVKDFKSRFEFALPQRLSILGVGGLAGHRCRRKKRQNAHDRQY